MATKTYWVWAEMIARCTNKNHKFFDDYGGRGILVCDRWKKSKNFIDDMGECPDGLSLDRIDNSKGYSPENCRWASRQIQSINRRIFKINKFGISGIEPRDDKYRVRIRHQGKIIINKTTPDFFEACCIRKSYESRVIKPLLESVMRKAA